MTSVLSWIYNIFQFDLRCGSEIVEDEMEIDLWEGVPVIHYKKKSSPPHSVKMPTIHYKKMPSSPQRIQILDKRAGIQKRTFYLSVLQKHGDAVCARLIGISDVFEAGQLETYIVSEINRIRSDFRVLPVHVSGLLSQAAKSQSQFYSGHCLLCQNNMPFRYMSYAINRIHKQSLRSCAQLFEKHWRGTENMLNELCRPSLREIGVGVFSTTELFVITIVR